MADFDDDRPDVDAALGGDPEDEPRRPRRGLPRRRRRGEDDLDAASTGEVPRSGLRRFASRPPREADDDDLGFGEEPTPGEPASERGPARPRPSRPRARAGGSRRAGRGGGGIGGGGAGVLQNPRARLVLAVLFAAILILVITLVVRDCQRNQLEDQYTSYLNGVAKLVGDSAEQGQQLRQVLANPRGDRPPALTQKITALTSAAEGLVDEAETLDPPGSLDDAQSSFVTALEYRVTGLRTLADNLPRLLQSNNLEFQANSIAGSMQRFLASDVIYKDSFAGPAEQALEDDDFSGTPVPKAQPFLPNASLATEAGARALLPNLRRRTQAQGGSDGTGNLRGTSLSSTEALPSGTRLQVNTSTSVQAGADLQWRVTVENGGDFDESGITVTATFTYSNDPNQEDVKEASIDALASGETTTVTIPGPTNPVFGEEASLRVDISAVPNESSTENNSAEYPVKITI